MPSGLIVIAAPGASEHQTGLAVDIVGLGNPRSFATPRRGTPERWLIDNAHRYGFIYRYQGRFSRETGVAQEPWHLRFVGVQDARNIRRLDISLENYIRSSE